ncbi:hypothetical protein Rin_00011040, partial [Candidatus Regiella insecticola 5.15]
ADRLNDNFIDEVRTQANGHWEAILRQLAIPTHRQEGQCPNCGGILNEFRVTARRQSSES